MPRVLLSDTAQKTRILALALDTEYKRVRVLSNMVVDRGNLIGTNGFNCSFKASARCDVTQYNRAR